MKPASPAATKPRKPRPAVYDLETSIGYLLNRAAHIVAARFSDDLLPHDVNLQTWRVLAALSHKDRRPMTDLAEHTAAELSYLSRTVAAAEKRGFVQRVASPTDRRTVLLSLTPAGRALVAKLAPRGEEIQRVALAGVSAADYETTLNTLNVIYNNLVTSSEGQPSVNRKLIIARRVRQRSAG